MRDPDFDFDFVTLGESMVSLRASGLLRAGGPLSMSVAGAESNVAIALARLGHRTSWISRLGDDELGTFILRALRAEGVDVSAVAIGPDSVTGMLFFDRGVGGTTRAHYRRAGSAAAALAPTHLSTKVLRRARWLHLTGITPALGPDPRRAFDTALEVARETNMPTSLDVNYRSALWSRDEARSFLSSRMPVNVLIASEDELDLVIDGRDETAQVRALHDLGVRDVLVTRGHRGATLHNQEERVDSGIHDVPLVDPVGAGDAFAAGYISGCLDGCPPAGRLDRAVALGAAAVSAIGDWEGLPSRGELKQWSRQPVDVRR